MASFVLVVSRDRKVKEEVVTFCVRFESLVEAIIEDILKQKKTLREEEPGVGFLYFSRHFAFFNVTAPYFEISTSSRVVLLAPLPPS